MRGQGGKGTPWDVERDGLELCKAHLRYKTWPAAFKHLAEAPGTTHSAQSWRNFRDKNDKAIERILKKLKKQRANGKKRVASDESSEPESLPPPPKRNKVGVPNRKKHKGPATIPDSETEEEPSSEEESSEEEVDELKSEDDELDFVPAKSAKQKGKQRAVTPPRRRKSNTVRPASSATAAPQAGPSRAARQPSPQLGSNDDFLETTPARAPTSSARKKLGRKSAITEPAAPRSSASAPRTAPPVVSSASKRAASAAKQTIEPPQTNGHTLMQEESELDSEEASDEDGATQAVFASLTAGRHPVPTRDFAVVVDPIASPRRIEKEPSVATTATEDEADPFASDDEGDEQVGANTQAVRAQIFPVRVTRSTSRATSATPKRPLATVKTKGKGAAILRKQAPKPIEQEEASQEIPFGPDDLTTCFVLARGVTPNEPLRVTARRAYMAACGDLRVLDALATPVGERTTMQKRLVETGLWNFEDDQVALHGTAAQRKQVDAVRGEGSAEWRRLYLERCGEASTEVWSQ